eukprot:6467728-Amphidinium_carterae.2
MPTPLLLAQVGQTPAFAQGRFAFAANSESFGGPTLTRFGNHCNSPWGSGDVFDSEWPLCPCTEDKGSEQGTELQTRSVEVRIALHMLQVYRQVCKGQSQHGTAGCVGEVRYDNPEHTQIALNTCPPACRWAERQPKGQQTPSPA